MSDSGTAIDIPEWVVYPRDAWVQISPPQPGFDEEKLNALTAGLQVESAAWHKKAYAHSTVGFINGTFTDRLDARDDPGRPVPEWAKWTGDPFYDNYAYVEPGPQGIYAGGDTGRLTQALTALVTGPVQAKG